MALYCSVDPAAVDIQYDEDWHDQEQFWKRLKANPDFRGRKFPDLCDPKTWNDGVRGDFQSGSRAVVLTASMNLSQSKSGPPLLLELQPLKHEQSCRLHRRFGSDRFLDLRIPSLDSWNITGLPTEGLQTALAQWLTRNSHHFLARSWAAFWIRSEGRKSTSRETQIGTKTETSCYERVSFFATDGAELLPAPFSSPRKDENHNPGVNISRDAMLKWLLQFHKNGDKPYLKLFSRISLGAIGSISYQDLSGDMGMSCTNYSQGLPKPHPLLSSVQIIFGTVRTISGRVVTRLLVLNAYRRLGFQPERS